MIKDALDRGCRPLNSDSFRPHKMGSIINLFLCEANGNFEVDDITQKTKSQLSLQDNRTNDKKAVWVNRSIHMSIGLNLKLTLLISSVRGYSVRRSWLSKGFIRLIAVDSMLVRRAIIFGSTTRMSNRWERKLRRTDDQIDGICSCMLSHYPESISLKQH